MNVNVPCPQCGTVFTVRRELLGKRTKCTHCGTPFTIAAAAPAQTLPPPAPASATGPATGATGSATGATGSATGATGSASAPPTASHIFSEIPAAPPHSIPAMPQITTEPLSRTATAPPPTFFGEESHSAQPRFGVLRMVARGYEILAVLVLAFAAVVLLMFVIAVVKQPTPDVIVAAVLSTGLAFFWALLIAISLLAFAQAIRLALAIEENTRQTHQACRQLADHLCSIETEP